MNAETPAEMATTLMQGVIDSEDPPQARSPRRPLLPTSFLPASRESMTAVGVFSRMTQPILSDRFYILGGKDGGESIRQSAMRRTEAIANDKPPPFGGGFSSDANKAKFDKMNSAAPPKL